MANNIIDDHIRGCPACGYRWSCRQKASSKMKNQKQRGDLR